MKIRLCCVTSATTLLFIKESKLSIPEPFGHAKHLDSWQRASSAISQASITALNVTTKDNVPPFFESNTPAIATNGLTCANVTLSLALTKACTIYYQVLLNSTACPSAAAVCALPRAQYWR